jgi:hypothetical protein
MRMKEFPKGVDKQGIEDIKANIRRGLEKGLRDHPEDTATLLKSMGVTPDTFEAWLDRQFDGVITEEENDNG